MEAWPYHGFVEQVFQSKYSPNHGVFVDRSDFTLNGGPQIDRRFRGAHGKVNSGIQALGVRQIVSWFEFSLRAPILQVSYHPHHIHVWVRIARAARPDFLP